MEEGTFMTGVEIQGFLTPTYTNLREKQDDKQIPSLYKSQTAQKSTRAATQLARSLQPFKGDALPNIQNRDGNVKSAMLHHSMSDMNFKKPIFKKLANVKDTYEKNKSVMENTRMKSPASAKTPLFARTAKEDRFYTHADAYDEKIVKRYDDLYQTRKTFGDLGSPESFGKRKHLFNEIHKQEDKVRMDQKKFDHITYDIQRKEQLLKGLNSQVQELDKKLEDTFSLEEMKVKKNEELLDWQEKIEFEEHKNESLNHMKQLKKELLLSIKKKYNNKLGIYEHIMEEISHHHKDEEYNKVLYVKNKLTAKEIKRKAGLKDNLIDQEFEDILEEEFSEFEERRNIREMLKHEKEIEEEHRRQEEEEHKKAIIARENRLREEEYKRQQKNAEHERELNKMKRAYNELQKITHVSKKEQLVGYYESLELRSDVLEKESDLLEMNIKEDRELLVRLEQELKYQKFEKVDLPKDQYPPDIRMDDLEIILRTKLNESAERENNIKRLEKLSFEVCTVVSRILKQLQKSNTPVAIDKSNVVDLLSVCGLKLERMLTMVIKKKKTFFIESINTDGTIKEGPPAYMNIVAEDVYNKSKKRYEKERANTISEDLEDSNFSTIRDNIKHRDEFDSNF